MHEEHICIAAASESEGFARSHNDGFDPDPGGVFKGGEEPKEEAAIVQACGRCENEWRYSRR